MQITCLLNFALLLTISVCLPAMVAAAYSNTSFAGGGRTAKPGCQSKCGDLTVPYPFGIGVTCSVDPFYDIYCNTSFDPPKAFLASTELEVLGISEEKIRIKNRLSWACYDKLETTVSRDFWMNLSSTPFSFSTENKLTVVGCDDVVLMSREVIDEWGDFDSSCVAVCSKPGDLSNGFCSGIGCCQSSIPEGLQSIYATMTSLNDHKYVSNVTRCGYSFLAEQHSYTFNVSDTSDTSFINKIRETVSFVIDWAIGSKSCNQIEGTSEIICQEKSVCVDSGSILGGYRCNCSQGYQGNPYLSPGCQGQLIFMRATSRAMGGAENATRTVHRSQLVHSTSAFSFRIHCYADR